jgi:phosphatidylglycerol:prolipoprotein diacylglycerol transferase
MYPKLFGFLPTYGLLFASSAVLAWWWFIRRGATLGLPREKLFDLGFYSLIAGIVGAKLTLVLLDLDRYWQDPAALWSVLRTAGVLMGGVAAGAAAFVVYSRRHGLPLFRLGDAIAAPLALAQGIGRLGCLMAGCCWGRPATEGAGFCVKFHSLAAHEQTGVPLGICLVPTQAYQMIHDLLLALLLALLWRWRRLPAGTVFWVYVILYSIGRGVIEHWRGDVQRGLYFGEQVSTSQIIAAVALVLGVVMLVRGWLRPPGSASRRTARARR